MRWIIKRKSGSGKRIESIFDTKTRKWREQKNFADGAFEAEPDDARALRDTLQNTSRGYEWIKLYQIV
jgi:hypothetical protein